MSKEEPLKIDIHDTVRGPDEALERLKESVDRAQKTGKVQAFLLFVVTGETLGVYAAGRPVEVVAMFTAGAEVVRSMVSQSVAVQGPKPGESKH